MTDYKLYKGAHSAESGQRCAMEWVSWIAGEPHTDSPRCVSPVLAVFCRPLNDVLDDDMRQRMRPYLARCIGTAGDGLDEWRGYLCLDWIVRTYTPAWLALAGLDEDAARLRALSPIVDLASAKAAGPVVRAAREKAVAAQVAAQVAARDAAWDAAWTAAGVAAGAAAWAAAGTAARVAAWAAAGDAPWAALALTIRELQVSALELLDRMLPTVAVVLPEDAAARAKAIV